MLTKETFFFRKLEHQKEETHVGTAGPVGMNSKRKIYEIIMQF